MENMTIFLVMEWPRGEDMKISLVIKGTEKSWRWTGDIEGRIQQKPGVLSAQLSS